MTSKEEVELNLHLQPFICRAPYSEHAILLSPIETHLCPKCGGEMHHVPGMRTVAIPFGVSWACEKCRYEESFREPECHRGDLLLFERQ